MRYRATDLFCCQGGASVGLYRAGFQMIGVDIKPQPKYPYEFYQDDALNFPLEDADFVWASPPCQGYSNLTPHETKATWAKLIPEVRKRLREYRKPYCIENVAGAKNELINPVMLCGSMFGLRTQRHRYFEVSFPLSAPKECDHREIPLLVTTASKGSREKRFKLGMQPKTVKNAPLAYGIDWMDSAGLKEAIPPAYAQFIGTAALEFIRNKKRQDRPSTRESDESLQSRYRLPGVIQWRS